MLAALRICNHAKGFLGKGTAAETVELVVAELQEAGHLKIDEKGGASAAGFDGIQVEGKWRGGKPSTCKPPTMARERIIIGVLPMPWPLPVEQMEFFG